MNIPGWLSDFTGAAKFANNPANGFRPTFGDALQAIGHDMMQNYRANMRQGEGGPMPSPFAQARPPAPTEAQIPAPNIAPAPRPQDAVRVQAPARMPQSWTPDLSTIALLLGQRGR